MDGKIRAQGLAAILLWAAGTAGLSYALALLLALRGPFPVFLPVTAAVFVIPSLVLLPGRGNMLVRLMGCRAMSRRMFGDYHRILEELSLRMGVSKPELVRAGGKTINAAALGPPRRGYVLLSGGAVNSLVGEEAAVVLAGELEDIGSGRAWRTALLMSLFCGSFWFYLLFGMGWTDSSKALARHRWIFTAVSMANMAFFAGLLLGEAGRPFSLVFFYLGLPGFLLVAYFLGNLFISLPLLFMKSGLGKGRGGATGVAGEEALEEVRLKAVEAQLTTSRSVFERMLRAGSLNLLDTTFLGDAHTGFRS
ncbi:MAG: hypothetical protein SWK76_16875 [Actinomycetota bacterium]|nr:hypothetical protein [Actinomycetota bacterium]